jgi:MarR family transcriptional regulator, organic hydroperoxide resistance regulator
MSEKHEHGERAEGERFVDDYLLYLMARASHVVSAEFHGVLRRAGVQVPVWRVLATLSGSPGETVSGLADACLLQQPTMTKLLDRMVRDQLVRRLPDERDRRVVRIQMTDRGQALVGDLLVAAKKHEAELLARHPDIDPAAFKQVMKALIARHRRGKRAAAMAA